MAWGQTRRGLGSDLEGNSDGIALSPQGMGGLNSVTATDA
jgi:hypothetical protein